VATIGSLCDALGVRLVELVIAPAGRDAPIAEATIFDQLDARPARPAELVLGVGISPDAAPALITRLGGARAAGLVLKLDGVAPAPLVAEAERAGVSVLAVPPSASWMQVVMMIRTALAQDSFGSPGESMGGVAAGDLFAVANAVAAMVDAPVTIEDAQSRVLAFSARQEEADTPRMETILGRQIPEVYLADLRRAGIFRKLQTESSVVYYESAQLGVKPRAVVGVRAGDEYLGSIWAAYKPPFKPEHESALVEAAKFVSIHLLRHRIVADVQRGLQSDLVAAVLDGGRLAGDAATRLGLSGGGFRVVALSVEGSDGDERDVLLMRHWDLLSLHISATHRSAASGMVGGAVYAIIPTPTDPERSLAVIRQTADSYLRRPATKERVLLGIGGHAGSLSAVPRSKRDADQVLRVLRSSSNGRAAAEIEEVRMQALLLELADLHRESAPSGGGKLARLLQQDAKHKTSYLETLRAYLDSFGDTAAAAQRLGIHQNTFRYRLKKLQEVSGIDLADGNERLGVLLQVRLLPMGESRVN
jgi:hypothetical protein